MKWPENYPPNCPLQDSFTPSFSVYYLVDDDPPSPQDFLSLKERNAHKAFTNDGLECQSCGLSVFTNKQGIELAKKISRGLRKKKTASALLPPESGLIKNTKSANTGDSHHTWWPHKEFKPWTIFQVIE